MRLRGWLAIRYIFWEMLPGFFLGVLVFVFILLMFQALRLTEFVLVHGVKITTVAQIVGYLSISFLPAIFPMSLLFAVLLTYGRLSAESEIIAMKSVGMGMKQLLIPALILGTLVTTLSAQTSFNLAPWGNRQFEVLVTRLAAQKTGVTIREGTFSEGFFNLVVYANEIDSKNGLLKNVFIYDERNPQMPVTIIAREGFLAHEQKEQQLDASLRLTNGQIHRMSEGRHTKIDFNSYDINLSNPISYSERKKSPQSLSIQEISDTIKTQNPDAEQKRILQTEYHKRWAISIACLLFSLIGVGLGTVTNRRNVRSGNLVICIGLIVVYWALYVVSENMARSGQIPPPIALWVPNSVFAIASFLALRHTWD